MNWGSNTGSLIEKFGSSALVVRTCVRLSFGTALEPERPILFLLPVSNQNETFWPLFNLQ